jgi:hypothetical protein
LRGFLFISPERLSNLKSINFEEHTFPTSIPPLPIAAAK